MARSLSLLAALCLLSPVSWAAPDEVPVRTAPAGQACSGLVNEVTKTRELNRELNAYAGSTVPDELQARVRKHITLVAQRKAECDHGGEQGRK